VLLVVSHDMSHPKALRRIFIISFALLLAGVGAFIYLISQMDHNKGEISVVPFTAFLTAVFIWQVFALSRHPRSFVLWLLAILYALAIVPFVIDMVRYPSARQIW